MEGKGMPMAPRWAAMLLSIASCVAVRTGALRQELPSVQTGGMSRPPIVDTATFAPDGEHVVVSFRRSPYLGLYVIALDGRACARLTYPGSEGYDGDAAYSQDGRRIAFVSKRGTPHPGIFVMNADGTGVERLTSGEVPDLGPAFSPDGNRIYFRRTGQKSSSSPLVRPYWHHDALCWVSADGKQEGRIVDLFSMSSPQIHPDGRCALVSVFGKLLWIELEGENPGHSVSVSLDMKPHVQHLPPIPHRPKAYESFPCYNPALSNSGHQLAFTWMLPYSTLYEVYVADIATGQFKAVTQIGADVRAESFSPADNAILCVLKHGVEYYKEAAYRFSDEFPGCKVTQPDEATKYVQMRDVEVVLWSNGKSFETRRGVSNLWVVRLDGSGEHNVPIDVSTLQEVTAKADAQAAARTSMDADETTGKREHPDSLSTPVSSPATP